MCFRRGWYAWMVEFAKRAINNTHLSHAVWKILVAGKSQFHIPDNRLLF